MRRRHLLSLLSCAAIVLSLVWGGTGLAAEMDQDRPIGAVGGAVHADPFTGVATASIPIQVPPGRNGIQPNLQLVYESAGGNGWVGMGWKLELGMVERQTRFGVNYSGDDYTFRLNGASADLVTIGSGEYRAKIEGGFTRIRKLTAADSKPYWEAMDKKGTRYLFGQTSATRLTDPGDASHILRWCLDRVEDTNGNYMTVAYVLEQGQVYLDHIDYTGNGSTAPTNTVRFYKESRADVADMYPYNFLVKTAYRLKTIDVLSNNEQQRVRAYKFNYSTSTTGFPYSVLMQVQQYGKDATLDGTGAVAGGTTLPAQSLTWTTGPTQFGTGTGYTGTWLDGACGNPATRTPYFGDYNGDGRTDLLCQFTDTGDWYVALSDGTKFGSGSGYTGKWLEGSCNNASTRTPYFGDYNGDGKIDLLCRFTDTGDWYVALSDGTKFGSGTGYSAKWLEGTCVDPATRSVYFGDFNGDGKTDLTCRHSDSGNWYVALSDGTKFGSGTGYTNNWLEGSCNNPSTRTPYFGDYNGDGKTDFLCRLTDTNAWYVALSDGTKFGSGTGFTGNWLDGACGSAYTPQFGDFNGDGKIDFLCEKRDIGQYNVALSDGVKFGTGTGYSGTWLDGVCSSANASGYTTQYADFNGDGKIDFLCEKRDIGQYNVALSDGVKFGTGTGYSGTWLDGVCSSANASGYTTQYADFNGDGKTDFLCKKQDIGQYNAALSGNDSAAAGLLASLQNGLGGTSTITYVPSTQSSNTQLPFPLQRVSAIATNDGNGNNATTSYTYTGGFYHLGERDYRGVNYTKVTGPVGPNGEQAVTETWFHQGNDTAVDVNNPYVANAYMKGKPYRIKVTNGAGAVLTETTISYEADFDGLAPFYTPPTQVDTNICDGTSCGKQTRTVSTYDSYGNVTREDHYGDLNDTSDDFTIVRTFALNTTSWIVGLPASETIYQGIGTSPQVAQTTFYYDETTSCSTASTNQTPAQGNLTRIVRWLSGGTNPEARMAYDSYGNRICTRDANGNVSTVTYDTSYTFPKVVTNALGHQATTQYYGVDGVPMTTGLYGQVKNVTDPNGAVTSMEHDVFGRKSKVTSPDGFWTTTAYNNFGTVGTQHVRTDSSLSLSSWTYFDGLGRSIKKKSTGPDSKITVTDMQYNVRGAVLKTSLPYFEGTGSPLWKTFIYDPVGRVTRTDNPDSTRGLACYDDWVNVTIDANNHKKREVKDSAGRLIRVDEYQGTFTTCDLAVGTPYATTTYQYDRLGNLRFVTDAKGNKTEMQYDSLSRKTAMHDPDMGDWTYLYDAAGNLTKQTDAKGQILWFQYDALNRLRQKDYGTQKTLDSGDVVYTYDGTSYNRQGRLQQVQDSSGTVSFQYDIAGRTIRTDKTIGSTTYTTQSGYDGLSRMTSLTYPDNSTVTNSFNGPLLQQVTEGSTTYAQYGGYNALGQPSTLTLGNGVVTTYTYQANTFRLTSLNTVSGSTTLQNLGYSYDSGGNVTALTDAVNGNQAFSYDEISRLLTATGPYGSLTYAYDQIGNMTSNSQVGSYTYPTSGQTSVQPHAVSTAGSNSYTYDANGNLTAGAGRTISYDSENRPISITQGEVTTTFVYDGDGGRVKKLVGTTTTTYLGNLYDCEDTGSGPQCVKYIFAGSQRIAMKQVSSGTVDYYHGDHLGSTSVMTTSAGTQEEGLTYYPYGAVRTDTGTTNVPYKYTGQELDGSTGLYFYNARYYDAALARFITSDTIIQNPRDPQTLNRYSYVGNNPIVRTDPTGHDFGLSFIIASIVVSTISSGVQSDWDAGATLTGAAIGGVAAGVGAGVGEAVTGAIGGKLGAVAGGVAGGAASGGTSAGLNAAAGRNVDIGLAIGAGAASGLVSSGLVQSSGFSEGWNVNPLTARLAGGVVGAAVQGGDLGIAALTSLGSSFVGTGVGIAEWYANTDAYHAGQSPSNSVGFALPNSVGGVLTALADGGPFSHAMQTDANGQILGATPGGDGAIHGQTLAMDGRHIVWFPNVLAHNATFNSTFPLSAHQGYSLVNVYGTNCACYTSQALSLSGYQVNALSPNGQFAQLRAMGLQYQGQK